MGVTGCGKTSVGSELANKLLYSFVDGDDLHSEINKAKMAAGSPLTDLDRKPWLQNVSKTLAHHENIIVACSALKKKYRDEILHGAPGAVFFHLDGSKELIASRLVDRVGHFMPIELLDSQMRTLEALEESEPGRKFDISNTVADIVGEMVNYLQ